MTEGDKAPDFEIETTDGVKRLADYAGKTLVLYFYPKDDTTGCTREAQDFAALAADFAKAGAAVLGVSKDSLKSHAKFTGKYDLSIPLGSDPEAAVIEAYGSWVLKTLYGREYMGIDRSTFLVQDGVIHRVWRKVKTPGHAQQVLEAVLAH
jgi:peroxiredoxin Q/BCP